MVRMVTCKLLRVEPEVLDDLRGFLDSGKVTVYDSKRVTEDEREEIEFKVSAKSESNKFGRNYTIQLDVPLSYYNRDSGHVNAKITKQFETQFYGVKEFAPTFALFVSGRDFRHFVNAMSEYLKNDSWNVPLQFKLHQCEEKLRNKFGNFRRFYTRDMDNDLVTKAQINGTTLERSPEYRHFLKDYHGTLSGIAIEFKGNWMLLTEDGKIFSPTADFNEPTIYATDS